MKTTTSFEYNYKRKRLSRSLIGYLAATQKLFESLNAIKNVLAKSTKNIRSLIYLIYLKLYPLLLTACPVKTVKGKCCVFPFKYKGKIYASCTTKNSKFPWCSLTSNYDKDKKWGKCKSKESFYSISTFLRSILDFFSLDYHYFKFM